jgi:RND family efflux transporter MFP subunit
MMRFHLALLLLLGASSAGCGTGEGEAATGEPAERPLSVRIVVVQPSDLAERLSLSGPLHAVRAVDVSSEEGGVVRQVPLDKGALVKEGDVLLELDRELLEAQMKAAEAAKTLREYNADRTQKLFDDNSISGQELLVAKTEEEQARQNFEIARLRYARAAIKAPFAGIVAERYVEPGQLIVAGTTVVRLVDPFQLELHGWLTDRDVAWAKVGAAAQVGVEGDARSFEGRVSWVGVEADPTTGKFPVELKIRNPKLQLRPGVVARAHVVKTVHESVLVIPRDAVVQSAQGTQVFVAVGDRAEQRSVQLGADQGLLVICTSGIAAGDRLIVRGQRSLSPGSPIAVQETSTRRDGWLPTDALELREDSADARFETGVTAGTNR